ncbi:MAG: hypothetical protein JXQ30_01250 [Spirochaetes bacterium]|nr:hypothetical protein [Spirochaetota bacterium]
MQLHIGVKSDAIQNRYTYEWLFGLIRSYGIRYLQLGGLLEMPLLEDGFYHDLRDKAGRYGIRIKSLYAAHRITAGFFSRDPLLERAARRIYEIYIHAGGVLGADYVGANAGVVYQDHPEFKEPGIESFLGHVRELMSLAKREGVKGITVEAMSCSFEWPTTPAEIRFLSTFAAEYHREHADTTVPLYILGDVSHGYANEQRVVVHSHYDIFESAIPYMCEFHFKNTDGIYDSTFGFSEGERKTGVVDLRKIKKIIESNAGRWPVDEVVGYLELPGPKFGRDYSDPLLKRQLAESLEALLSVFGPP